MKRLLLAALLLVQDEPTISKDLDDASEEAIESAEIHLAGVAEQLRTFSVDSVMTNYAPDFRGELFFAPLPADAPSRDLGMGVTEWTADEKGRKREQGDLAKNLSSLASIEDVQFKFPAGTFEPPRLKCRLKITLVGRGRDGSGVMWQEEYNAQLRRDVDRWEIAVCDRAVSRRQRADRPCLREEAVGLSIPMLEQDEPSPWNEPYASLGGIAAGDFDGDGDDDLFVPNIGNVHLFRNDDGAFTDVTKEMGIEHHGPAASALFLDTDNDADLDLLIVDHATAKLRNDRKMLESRDWMLTLYRNDGKGFTDVTKAAKLGGVKGPATSCCAADYDNDGFVDFFVACYADVISEDQAMIGNMPKGSVTDSRDGAPDQLWHNNGDGTFTEVAVKAGVADPGRGYACAFGDLDADGRPDLYVANDFGSTGAYRNKGDGTFEKLDGARDRGLGMGVAFGDIDNDGRDEIYLSNMYSTAGNRILNRNPQGLSEEKRALLLKNARGNTMLKAKGDGTFEDVTLATNTGRANWAWGCGFGDFDLDGRLDLYVCSGYITGTTRADL